MSERCIRASKAGNRKLDGYQGTDTSATTGWRFVARLMETRHILNDDQSIKLIQGVDPSHYFLDLFHQFQQRSSQALWSTHWSAYYRQKALNTFFIHFKMMTEMKFVERTTLWVRYTTWAGKGIVCAMYQVRLNLIPLKFHCMAYLLVFSNASIKTTEADIWLHTLHEPVIIPILERHN